jgi:hypothetical protein
MTMTDIAHPQTSPTPATQETPTPEEEAARRRYCTWLEYWRDCTTATCRRRRVCAGDPTDCFIRNWCDRSEDARAWISGGIGALDGGLGPRAAARTADMLFMRRFKVRAKLPLHEDRRRVRV